MVTPDSDRVPLGDGHRWPSVEEQKAHWSKHQTQEEIVLATLSAVRDTLKTMLDGMESLQIILAHQKREIDRIKRALPHTIDDLDD